MITVEDVKKLMAEVFPEDDLESSDDFVEDGIITSLKSLELLNSIDMLFGVRIPPEAVVSDSFRSFESVAALVNQYA